MPKPNALVSTVIRFEPPLDRPPAEVLRSGKPITVALDGDSRARLSPDDPRSVGRAQVLEGLGKQGFPVYLELDPESGAISVLLIPIVSRVAGLGRNEDGSLDVQLELSHARLRLRQGEDFELFERRLTEAEKAQTPLVVTDDDATHEIVDVRPYEPGPEAPRPPLVDRDLPLRRPQRRGFVRWIDYLWRWRWWPWWWCWPWRRCISAQRAQQVFDATAATTCDPTTIPPPCIPFLYPDDGCWARAHEMCRLMIADGLSPRKVWIQGGLHVDTRNNPNCFVNWNWHVAPILCVCSRRFWVTRNMVIDPSLFTTPVTMATWKGVQGDPSATLTTTSADDYLWGETDPTYAKTNDRLAYYRLRLQNRSVQDGPPPYANCP